MWVLLAQEPHSRTAALASGDDPIPKQLTEQTLLQMLPGNGHNLTSPNVSGLMNSAQPLGGVGGPQAEDTPTGRPGQVGGRSGGLTLQAGARFQEFLSPFSISQSSAMWLD